MMRVYPVLTFTNAQGPEQISSSLAVNLWMTELRAMPYQYSTRWQTPAEVNVAQASDCKGKAVALYAEMRRNGAKNVRVVIGKHHIYDSATHAWLEWETKEGSFVLDPTFNEMPTRTAELDPTTYVPLYAYDAEHKYRAASAGSVTSTAKVAVGYGNPVYVPTGAGSTFAQPGLTGVASEKSFSATKKSATPSTQHRQSNLQHSGSNVRQSSPANVAKVRQSRDVAARSIARNVTQVHAKPMPTQKRSVPNARILPSQVIGVSQPRAIAATPSVKNEIRVHAKPMSIQKRSVSSARLSPSKVVGVSQPRVIAATPSVKNETQVHAKPMSIQKRSVPNARILPSKVAGVTQPRVIAATPKAKILMQVQPKAAGAGRPLSIQKHATFNARLSTPHAVGVRQTQSLSQNGKHVTQMQPRLAAAASQL